jgi:hypothetical protein
MQATSPKALAAKLIEAGLATPETVAGCSEEEISQLEAKAGVLLPAAYKDFLRTFGKECGTFLNDCCFLYSTLLLYCRPLAEELAHANELRLMPTWFVFLERDVMFLYFDTTQGDDPPVWRFKEGDSKPELMAESFSNCLNSLATVEIDAVSRKI